MPKSLLLAEINKNALFSLNFKISILKFEYFLTSFSKDSLYIEDLLFWYFWYFSSSFNISWINVEYNLKILLLLVLVLINKLYNSSIFKLDCIILIPNLYKSLILFCWLYLFSYNKVQKFGYKLIAL